MYKNIVVLSLMMVFFSVALLINTAVDAKQTKAIMTVMDATSLLMERAILEERVSEAADPCGLVVVECPGEVTLVSDEPVEALIRRMAVEAKFDPSTALRIAHCESTLNPEDKNAHSSATGLYQFTIGTWRWIGAEAAGLERTDPVASTAMFLKTYPKYPHYWECK